MDSHEPLNFSPALNMQLDGSPSQTHDINISNDGGILPQTLRGLQSEIVSRLLNFNEEEDIEEVQQVTQCADMTQRTRTNKRKTRGQNPEAPQTSKDYLTRSRVASKRTKNYP
jgi:hypothetical protein